MFRLTLGLLVAGTLAPGYGAVILSESFNNVATLPGAGWVQTNNSVPVGATGWFQGNPGVFTSNSGAPNAYIAANFLNTDPNGGDVSNWLITPILSLTSTTTLAFFTRSNGAAPDRLEVRLNKTNTGSNVGATATSVGDFTSLLLSVNPGLTPAGYPTGWTLFNVNVGATSGNVSGRLAFRYFFNDVTTNGDYIGIDDVVVDNGVVPEPSAISLFGGGLLALYSFARALKAKRRKLR